LMVYNKFKYIRILFYIIFKNVVVHIPTMRQIYSVIFELYRKGGKIS
jgi:hypothetical protein